MGIMLRNLSIVLLTIILCYIPASFCVVIVAALKNRILPNVRNVVLDYVTAKLLVVNFFFTPLVFAVDTRYFCVAFIQLLSRKTLAEAEELVKRIFESRRLGVVGTAESARVKASLENYV